MFRFIPRVACSASSVLALTSLLSIFSYGSPAPQSSASSTAAYTICYANSMSSGKEYLSAIFDAGKFDPHAHERQSWSTGELAFQKYIYMNVDTQLGTVGCQVYPSLARAQQVLQIWKNEEKARGTAHLVETGWVYKGPESNPPATQAANGGQYVLCYSDAGQSPFYLSGDIHIDEPPHPNEHMYTRTGPEARALDQLKSEFLTFIQKQYGYHTSSSFPADCTGNLNIPRDVTAKRDLLHNRFHQLQFVETGWVPGMTASADLSKPAATPAKSPVMSAYEQAMIAQKPKSVSGAALQKSINAANPAASSAAGKPKAAPEMYAYCSGTGSPRNGGGNSTHYVSTFFPGGANTRPVALFATYISHAHPQESIVSVGCSTPQPKESLEPNRRQAMEGDRKYGAVVEVKWDPEM